VASFRNIYKLLIAFLLLSGCGELDMGMQYQKSTLMKKGDISVNCYSLVWGFDSEAYFISFNNDVCLGFDSTKDYCYGRGNQVIYYKLQQDTLKIYSYGSKPTIPQRTALNISVMNISRDSLNVYETKFKNKEIEMVKFDSLYNLPCSLANPPINPRNIKFVFQ
jgi:hypothetical protein